MRDANPLLPATTRCRAVPADALTARLSTKKSVQMALRKAGFHFAHRVLTYAILVQMDYAEA